MALPTGPSPLRWKPMGKSLPCSVCGATATVHLTQIVQGKVTKVHLCESCAEKGGAGDPSVFQLAGALSGPGEGAGLSCPACRMTDAEFLRRGRLGCPACWEAFAPALGPLVAKMQRGGSHVGRSPLAPADPAEVRRRLEAAKAEMAEAVRAEDYEGAARLRDRIRELEGRLG